MGHGAHDGKVHEQYDLIVNAERARMWPAAYAIEESVRHALNHMDELECVGTTA